MLLAKALCPILALALGIGCSGNLTHYPTPQPAPDILPTNTGPTPVYVLAGQSNAVGCGPVGDLTPDEEAAPAGATLFIQGNGPSAVMGEWTPLVAGDGGSNALIGPELGFAKTMPAPVRVIKFAVGGTSMDTFWRSPGAGGAFPGYVYLLDTIKSALASDGVPDGAHLAGLLWLQGESDAPDAVAAATYQERLAAFVNDFRQDVGMPDLPVVVAQIHPIPGWTYAAEVVAAEAALPSLLPHVATFSTEDLAVPSSTNPHFGGEQQYQIGMRFAQQMQALLP